MSDHGFPPLRPDTTFVITFVEIELNDSDDVMEWTLLDNMKIGVDFKEDFVHVSVLADGEGANTFIPNTRVRRVGIVERLIHAQQPGMIIRTPSSR